MYHGTYTQYTPSVNIYRPQGWGANELALGWVSRRRHATPALPSHVSFRRTETGCFPPSPFIDRRSGPFLNFSYRKHKFFTL